MSPSAFPTAHFTPSAAKPKEQQQKDFRPSNNGNLLLYTNILLTFV
jgi:hypothetical protein